MLLKIIYHFVIFMVYLHVAGCLWFTIIESTYKKTLEHSVWCYEIDAKYEEYKPFVFDENNIRLDKSDVRYSPDMETLFLKEERRLKYFCNWFDMDQSNKPKPPEDFVD